MHITDAVLFQSCVWLGHVPSIINKLKVSPEILLQLNLQKILFMLKKKKKRLLHFMTCKGQAEILQTFI